MFNHEPASCQHVWHHHVHVFPRYEGDDFYRATPEYRVASIEQRLPYAEKLRGHLSR